MIDENRLVWWSEELTDLELLEEMRAMRRKGLTAIFIIKECLKRHEKNKVALHFSKAFGFDNLNQLDRIPHAINAWTNQDDKLNRFIERQFAHKRFAGYPYDGRPLLETVAQYYDLSTDELLHKLELVRCEPKIQLFTASMGDGTISYQSHVVTPEALIMLDELIPDPTGQRPPWWSW